jgi:uncharacterized membrane protein
MKHSNTHAKVLRTTQLAFLAALVAVLQVLSYTIKIGVFNLSLVLVPVVIGGILGTVSKVGDNNELTVKIADNTEITVIRGYISQVLEEEK